MDGNETPFVSPVENEVTALHKYACKVNCTNAGYNLDKTVLDIFFSSSQRLQMSPLSGPRPSFANRLYASFTPAGPYTRSSSTQFIQSTIKSFHAWFCRLNISIMGIWCLRTSSHSGMKNCSTFGQKEVPGFFCAVSWEVPKGFSSQFMVLTFLEVGERFVIPSTTKAERTPVYGEEKWAVMRLFKSSLLATSM